MTYSTPWLLNQLATGKTPEYIYFWGHRPAADGSMNKSCLSQWFAAGFTHEGQHFATAEHWMMWHKAMTFYDRETAARILATDDPKKAKSLGRKVKNYDDKLWATVKYPIVVEGNVLKFGQDPRLKDYLLGTGDAVLVEASPYDDQWGIGMGADEARRLDDPAQWRGTNLLGWALMEAREQIG
ncbi:MAG: NADAR family protein [Bacteroidota bacterium]